jgi:hypothetical protein
LGPGANSGDERGEDDPGWWFEIIVAGGLTTTGSESASFALHH